MDRITEKRFPHFASSGHHSWMESPAALVGIAFRPLL